MATLGQRVLQSAQHAGKYRTLRDGKAGNRACAGTKRRMAWRVARRDAVHTKHGDGVLTHPELKAGQYAYTPADPVANNKTRLRRGEGEECPEQT